MVTFGGLSVRGEVKKLGVVLLVLVAMVGSSCKNRSDGDAEPGPASACERRNGEGAAKAVLRCTEPSVAFVETEIGSGTGVVVELESQRYVLTNEHVVDPFDAADATVGERTFEALPVVGIDAGADIALLGPITASDPPAPLVVAEGTDLERGDDVYLVGYPGESSADDLEATISRGIVSRVRAIKDFDKTFIQTDASIGAGQSGGPLFDDAGRLVGISGLSFAEEFALALVGRDVSAAMARVLEGDGDDYLSVPVAPGEDEGERAGAFKIHDANDGQAAVLPAAETDRTWNITVNMEAKPVVTVASFADDEPLAVSSNTPDIQRQLARELSASRGGRPEDLLDPEAARELPKLREREKAPGQFAVPVKAGESAILTVAAPLTDGPIEVSWTSDLGVFVVTRPVLEKTVKVGDTIDHIFGSFDTSVDLLVELEAGQKVEFSAKSPVGDPYFDLYEPDQRLDHLTVLDPEAAGVESVDDSDSGLSGLDATLAFEAKTAGVHRLRVFSNEMITAHFRIAVRDCAETKCEDPPRDDDTD